MKRLVLKWNDLSLIVRIIIGLFTGVIVALVFPHATWIGIFGDIFVSALKAIAPVLVLILITSSLANANGGIGQRFKNVILLYMVTTFLAAVTSVCVSFIFPVTIELSHGAHGIVPGGIGEMFKSLILNILTNPVDALLNANYIGIVAWSTMFGLAAKITASGETKRVIKDLSDIASQVVAWVINLAPFGIMGLVYATISASGLKVFKDYGCLLLLIVVCMLLVGLVVNPIIAAICIKKNPYPLVFKCLKESGITAFFSRSSAANIPINMALCEELHLDKDIYSVSIPLGATINMNGAAVTITVMTLVAVHTLGIEVDLMSTILLSFLASLSACGTSGIAGGSLLLIPVTCALFGIPNDVAMQVVGVGFIIGVIQDSFETALNASEDVLFTAIAEYMEWKKQGRKISLPKN